jgi:hypothetical protein
VLISQHAWGLVLTEATMAGFRRVEPYVPLTAAGWRVRGGGRIVLAGVVGLYGAGGGGYGTPVGEAVSAAGAVHGFRAMQTDFIGRAGRACEPAVVGERFQLVTVAGPGRLRGAGGPGRPGVTCGGVAG